MRSYIEILSIRKKKRKKDIMLNLLTFFVIFQLLFAQFFISFPIYETYASSEDEGVEKQEVSQEEESEEEEEEGEENEEVAEEDDESEGEKEESDEKTEDEEDENENSEEKEDSEEENNDSAENTEDEINILNKENIDTENEDTLPKEEFDTPENENNATEELLKETLLAEFSTENNDGVENQDASKNSCETNTCPIDITVENQNDANIENDTEVISNTGNNSIEEEEEEEEKSGILDEALLNFTNESDEDNKEEKNEGDDEENKDEKIIKYNSLEDTEETLENESLPLGDMDEEYLDNLIKTGDAVSIVNIFNDINKNIIGDNWQESIYNIYDYLDGDINLLEQFLLILENSSDNPLPSEIKNVNIAEIENNVIANANTGENEINSDGENKIETGDAVAIANIVNIANNNLIGNNWLFSTINIFGDWVGNLIIPGEDLLTVEKGTTILPTEISNINDATIENNIITSANSGENEINGNTSEIITGDSFSQADTTNIINQNIISENNWFLLIVNNMGFWSGSVLNWNNENDQYENIYEYDFEESNDNDKFQEISVQNENIANIENNVTVTANTGGNKIITDDGNAEIKTGEASALANVFNFVNNNIIGNNWFFAVVNIMGSWVGDVEFAYPDLEVKISDNRDSVNAGENLSYEISIKNNGEAAAENVELLTTLSKYLSYQSTENESSPSKNNNELTWKFDKIDTGEEKTFSINTKVSDTLPENSTTIESASGVKTETKEMEEGNNVSVDKTTAYLPSSRSNSDWDYEDPETGLKIKREIENLGTIVAGNTIKYSITLKNSGDTPVYDVEVRDESTNPQGLEIGTYIWTIGDMDKDDEFLIEYEVFVSPFALPGVYENKASAVGLDSDGDRVRSSKKKSSVTVIAARYEEPKENLLIPSTQASEIPTEGVVLGANIVKKLPFWIWIVALFAYYLAINWSFFPIKIKK